MDRQSIVQEVEISHDGNTFKASYFVEGGIIHAHIIDRPIQCMAGAAGAESTVRAMLTAQVLQSAELVETYSSWAGRSSRH